MTRTSPKMEPPEPQPPAECPRCLGHTENPGLCDGCERALDEAETEVPCEICGETVERHPDDPPVHRGGCEDTYFGKGEARGTWSPGRGPLA